jgi:hypothetical protein
MGHDNARASISCTTNFNRLSDKVKKIQSGYQALQEKFRRDIRLRGKNIGRVSDPIEKI